ncbi:unnamed protein product [Linum tenue]|uniref:Uncharacterized protein n=1 Tax=Linum tenue TaxID=586396 RepID=A0AAV0LKT7_9ROSI|nr:unnamed protein product [Linum tenue]
MSSDSAVASPARKKPRRRWWDSGIVSGSRKKVTVALMSRKNKTAASYDNNDTIRTATVTVVAPDCYFRGKFSTMGLAVVDSKLYAFGGRQINTSPSGNDDSDDDGFTYWKYPRDVFVCDLGTDPDIQQQPLKFQQYPALLKGPKVEPIHVPYNDKIFILSRVYDPMSFNDLSAPCEVLDLKDMSTQIVDLPWEMWDPNLIQWYNGLPDYLGHVVVGRELIVYMHTFVGSSVFALDMEELKWRRIMTEHADHDDISPMRPNLTLMMYPWDRLPEAHCSNLVHNGRLFMVSMPDHRPFEVIRVKYMSNPWASYDHLLLQQEQHKIRDMRYLSDYALGLVPDDCKFGDARVVPFGDGDVYCLFLWWGLTTYELRSQFKVCKFRLIGEDGGCEILGTVEDFSAFSHDFGSSRVTAFTRTSYIEMGVY